AGLHALGRELTRLELAEAVLLVGARHLHASLRVVAQLVPVLRQRARNLRVERHLVRQQVLQLARALELRIPRADGLVVQVHVVRPLLGSDLLPLAEPLALYAAAELPETDPRPADVAKPGLLRADQTEEPVVVRRPERGLLHLLEPIAGFDAGRARLPVRPQLPTHLLTEESLLLPQLLHHRRVHIQVPALDALDLTRKALLDAEVRRHELPALAERPGPEPDGLPTHAGERAHGLLRPTEVLCRALPVDVR